MKYTKYLIDGEFVDVDSIRTDRKLLKVPVRIVGLTVAVVAIATIAGMIPMAFMVDEARNTKARIIHFKRNGYKL